MRFGSFFRRKFHRTVDQIARVAGIATAATTDPAAIYNYWLWDRRKLHNRRELTRRTLE